MKEDNNRTLLQFSGQSEENVPLNRVEKEELNRWYIRGHVLEKCVSGEEVGRPYLATLQLGGRGVVLSTVWKSARGPGTSFL